MGEDEEGTQAQPVSHKQPRNLSPLLTTLEKEFGFNVSLVCAGYNDLAVQKDMGITQKVWLTHTAALRRHAAGPDKDKPCLIVEDDVEFLTGPEELEKELKQMLEKRPDFKIVVLGALPLGITVPIGGGLAMCQAPVLTQSVLYHPDFVRQFVESGDVIAAPLTGEGWSLLPFRDRLISSKVLTTQSAWPRTASVVKNLYPSFTTLHRQVFGFMVYGVPILFSVFLTGILCCAALYGLTGSTVALVCLIVCIVGLLVVTGIVVGSSVATNPRHSLQWWSDLKAVASNSEMLQDFCPL